MRTIARSTGPPSACETRIQQTVNDEVVEQLDRELEQIEKKRRELQRALKETSTTLASIEHDKERLRRARAAVMGKRPQPRSTGRPALDQSNGDRRELQARVIAILRASGPAREEVVRRLLGVKAEAMRIAMAELAERGKIARVRTSGEEEGVLGAYTELTLIEGAG